MRGIEKLELRTYSYKELCSLFGENTKEGNSKVAQKREWASFFKWSNPTTQQYLIEKIYDMPLEKQDGRKGNGGNTTSKFLALDDMIMDYFSEDVRCFSGTLSTLCVKIGVLSKKYLEYRNAQHGLIQQGIPSYVVHKFFWSVRSCVHRAMVSSLKRLNKEGHLKLKLYITLRLKHGTTVELDEEMTRKIERIEDVVLVELGMSRTDLQNEKNEKLFKSRVNAVILEKHGYDILYYFRMYDIRICDRAYQKKSDETYDKLTRKFVKTIACSMLQIEIPDTPDSPSSTYTQTQMIRDTIELFNQFFVYMTPYTWDRYWDDEEVDYSDNANNREILFWTQFCLVKSHDDWWRKQKSMQEKFGGIDKPDNIDWRDKAILEIGIDDVSEYEKIIPNLDWERVYNATDEKDEYLQKCEKILDIYYRTESHLHFYDNQEVAKAYALYKAHAVSKGRDIYELMNLQEFEESYKSVIT